VSGDPELFSAAQRTSIGVCVTQLSELAQAVRGYGVRAGELDQLEHAFDALAGATSARKAPPPANRLNAALAQMLVLEEELRPRRLAAYGTVDPEAARILDEHVQRLVDLTNTLIDRLQKAISAT
jgi:hypothetical protein